MFKACLNFNPVSCGTVKVSPAITGVTPSARRIDPLDGSAVAITVKAAEAKLVSTALRCQSTLLSCSRKPKVRSSFGSARPESFVI
jgi:hypothetical protein